jgi:hypothetical protein
MDRLIVDQLGCMAIARTENEDKVYNTIYQYCAFEKELIFSFTIYIPG